MVTVERQAIVPYNARDMYALVDDVAAYPEFLPWCSGAEIGQFSEQCTVATLHVRFRGVRQQFTTENAKVPGERITMRLVSGPFRQLAGEWRFVALSEEACRVELELSYELASAVLGRLVGPVFNYIANSFVDAFVQRADVLYGRR